MTGPEHRYGWHEILFVAVIGISSLTVLSKENTLTVEVNVRTQSGSSFRAPSVPVKVVSEEGLSQVLVLIASTTDVRDGIPATEFDRFFQSLVPVPGFEDIVTDARGKALIQGVRPEQFISVHAIWRNGKETEDFLWLIPATDAREPTLQLDNRNLVSPVSMKLLLERPRLKKAIEACQLRAKAAQFMKAQAFDEARALTRQAEALSDAEKAVRLRSEIDRAEAAELRRQAETELAANRFDPARKLAERARALAESKAAETLLGAINRAQAFQFLEKAEEALKRNQFEEARKLARRAESLGESDEASQFLMRIARQEDRLQAPSWIAQARGALEQKDYDKARALMERVTSVMPESDEVQHVNGILFQEAGGPVRAFTGHTGAVCAVTFGADGRVAVAGGRDNALSFWEVATGREMNVLREFGRNVISFAFGPNGEAVLCGSADNTLSRWRAKEPKQKIWETTVLDGPVYTPEGAGTGVIALSTDCRFALCGASEGGFLRCEFATLHVTRFGGIASPVCSLAFSPDSHFALCGTARGEVVLCELATGDLVRFDGHRGPVRSVAFSTDGALALSGGEDKTMRLWGLKPPRRLQVLEGHGGEVTCVAFRPDGLFALSGSRDNTVKFWNVTTGRKVATYAGHEAAVLSVAFSPDGCLALSGSADKTVKLWQLPRKAREKHPDDAP